MRVLNKLNKFCAAAAILAAAGLCFGASAHAQTTIQFSGYVWDVRPAEIGGPGPNHWDPSCVRVDSLGRLHLRLTHRNGQWQCAEVSTQKSFGFGRYEFEVAGPLDKFDPNIVLGLFDYPNPGQGPDGTNEIDIEYSRWGKPAALPASTTIYPATAAQAKLGPPAVSYAFPVPPGLSDTTQCSTRTARSVRIQCRRGHSPTKTGDYARWLFHPSNPQRLPQSPLPVHINLWLFQGEPPVNGQGVEVVVKRFTFIPSSGEQKATTP